MFLLGQALDRRVVSFRGVMLGCLGVAAAGGALSFWAPVLSRLRGLGVTAVVVSRSLLGAGSAVSVIASPTSRRSCREDRTGLFATTIDLQRAARRWAPWRSRPHEDPAVLGIVAPCP